MQSLILTTALFRANHFSQKVSITLEITHKTVFLPFLLYVFVSRSYYVSVPCVIEI